ncbi:MULTISPECIES: hypothetical protein [unclassified Shinella]|nr:MULTISPECIES: hypothetical protein [unclassified Shinella]MCO5138813.1 hypothetical protein [Shinella sp.]MDC7255651.1 hypothetical protein [Shinella sp. YE25]CAK7256905.1 Transmembrane protein [Shinella sp. WSC3-e]
MRSRLLHPGTLFVTALVFLVLSIPLAQMQLSRPHGQDLRQALMLRAG